MSLTFYKRSQTKRFIVGSMPMQNFEYRREMQHEEFRDHKRRKCSSVTALDFYQEKLDEDQQLYEGWKTMDTDIPDYLRSKKPTTSERGWTQLDWEGRIQDIQDFKKRFNGQCAGLGVDFEVSDGCIVSSDECIVQRVLRIFCQQGKLRPIIRPDKGCGIFGRMSSAFGELIAWLGVDNDHRDRRSKKACVCELYGEERAEERLKCDGRCFVCDKIKTLLCGDNVRLHEKKEAILANITPTPKYLMERKAYLEARDNK